jgi:hypothetical protein
MSEQAGSPNRVVVGSGDPDSRDEAGAIDYAQDIAAFHRALEKALETQIGDAIAEFGSCRELRERVSSEVRLFAEEFSDHVLLSSVSRLHDDFWERLTQSFLNRCRDPREELDEIRSYVRQVWGEHSSSESFLDDLLSHVSKSRVEEMSLGELRSAARSLDSNAEKDRLAFWFSAGEQALMAVRFRWHSDGKEDRLLRPEELSEALHAGTLSGPDGPQLVEQFSEKVFPCFVILKRLRRLAEERAK